MRQPATTFADRHLGPRPEDIEAMLAALGVATLDELIDQAVPKTHPGRRAAAAPGRLVGARGAGRLRELAGRNQVLTSLIGDRLLTGPTPRA